ncbi:MAG: carbohydrate-binding protein [Treponema sp.]
MEQILTFEIKNGSGAVLSADSGRGTVHLVYAEEYRPGDTISLSVSDPGCFLVIQFDSCLNPAFVYMKERTYTFEIPFEEKRFSYDPKTFSGNLHLLKARCARAEEISVYKNLALNDHDSHANTACFPHARANIETRGEAVFAARNAINGNCENRSHGKWPYESWGINRDPAALFTLEFGRPVDVDTIVLVCRADFPHDNYWKQVDVGFSDGTVETLFLEKSEKPHSFKILPKTTEYITLGNLIKDETLDSPFPALTQIEVYGTERSK